MEQEKLCVLERSKTRFIVLLQPVHEPEKINQSITPSIHPSRVHSTEAQFPSSSSAQFSSAWPCLAPLRKSRPPGNELTIRKRTEPLDGNEAVLNLILETKPEQQRLRGHLAADRKIFRGRNMTSEPVGTRSAVLPTDRKQKYI